MDFKALKRKVNRSEFERVGAGDMEEGSGEYVGEIVEGCSLNLIDDTMD